MKYICMTFLIFSTLSLISTAEAQFKLSVQPGVQLPQGDFSNTASVGFGGSVTGEYRRIQKKANVDWSITGLAGFYHFTGSKDLPEGQEYSYTDIPIQIGLRYYLARSDFKPYLGAELGFHLLSISRTVNAQEVKLSDTYFGFAPIIGFKSYFTQDVQLDVNVKLNSISSEGSSLSFLGFNFGAQFELQ